MMRRLITALAVAVGLAALPLSASHADPKGKKIAYLTTAIDIGYISTLAKAVTEGAKKYGMEVTVFSSPFDPARQSQQMDDAIARKFDMIILSAVSEQAIVPALLRAHQANIPVMALIGAPKAGTEKLYISNVSDDMAGLGRIAAQSILDGLKASGHDGGKVAAITGSLQEGVAPIRLAAFKKVLATNPKVQLVAVEDTAWDTAKSEQVAAQLFARYASQGGLNAVYGMADNQAVAIIQAAQAANLKLGVKPTDNLFVVSSNCYKQGIDAIRAGTLYSTATQIPTVAGHRAAEAAADYFSGKKLPQNIVIPVDRITKANVDKWAAGCSF